MHSKWYMRGLEGTFAFFEMLDSVKVGDLSGGLHDFRFSEDALWREKKWQ